jgi:hypothetical protein
VSLSLSLPETASNYKQTVQSAFLEVQDILGDLGLGDDDGLHGNNQSVQEVKVSYQGDGNSLESPPDSEKDPFEVLDSLLDFGLDDDMTISKGSGYGGGATTGADLVKSTIEVQRALKVREIQILSFNCYSSCNIIPSPIFQNTTLGMGPGNETNAHMYCTQLQMLFLGGQKI